MTINIPQSASKIISILEQNGYEAFVVGGCVRDSIMGNNPHDWDICTSALPDQIIQCFDEFHIIETGLQHGTITIMINHEAYEVTTFRIDGEYLDNRHPEQVKFVSSLKDDLSRRDFTINAIAYSHSTGIMDYYDGLSDINKQLIRCVGYPDERFNEDALRIMRALRFASVLKFSIADSVNLSIHKNKELLKKISVERINSELCKLLLGSGVEAIFSNYKDIISVIIPEICPMFGFNQNTPYHYLDVWNHTIQTVTHAPQDIVIRLTMFFHDIAKPMCYTQDESGIGHFYGHPKHSADMAFKIMKRLKFNNEILYRVKDLIFYHDVNLLPRNKHVKRWLNKIGEEKLRQLLQVKRADTMGQTKRIIAERLRQLDAVENCINNIIEQCQCFSLKDLAVNGNDLITAGVPKGVQVGITLNKLMYMVIDEQIENNKTKLLEAIKS